MLCYRSRQYKFKLSHVLHVLSKLKTHQSSLNNHDMPIVQNPVMFWEIFILHFQPYASNFTDDSCL